MTYCPNCGSPLDGNTCENCGMDISIIQEQLSRSARHKNNQKQDEQDNAKILSKKPLVIIILSIISAVMVLVAGSFVWWWIDYDFYVTNPEKIGGGYAQADFTLNEVHQDFASSHGDPVSDEYDRTLVNSEKEASDGANNLLLVIFILMVINIIPLGLIMGTEKKLEKAKYIKKLANLSVILLSVALILMIIVPFYYMIAWPKAFYEFEYKDDEIDEDSEDRVYDGSFEGANKITIVDEEPSSDRVVHWNASWGPGIGWIYSFFCIIPIALTFISSIFYGNKSIDLARSAKTQSDSEEKLPPEIERKSPLKESENDLPIPPPLPPPPPPPS